MVISGAGSLVSLLFFKHEGQKGQMTSCECDLCLCKVGNGKVEITVLCVKGSGEQYSTWARTKPTMSQEIRPFPVKALAQNTIAQACHRVTQRRQEVLSNAYPGTNTVNTLSFQLFTFRGGSKGP